MLNEQEHLVLSRGKKVVKPKKLLKNEYFITAFIISLMLAMVVGFFYGSQFVLNTPNPIVTVESGSMCIPYDGRCDGWSHPFDQTLHVGDILIVQGIDPNDYNAFYPNSDIIVFQDTLNNRLIVHRIVGKQIIDGVLYYQTKGDGNSYPDVYPKVPTSNEYDQFYSNGVPADLVVGKVIARIPWFGHITLFMDPAKNPVGRPIVIGIIVMLVIVEFVVPLAKKKPTEEQKS
jgi:signal peptidase I